MSANRIHFRPRLSIGCVVLVLLAAMGLSLLVDGVRDEKVFLGIFWGIGGITLLVLVSGKGVTLDRSRGDVRRWYGFTFTWFHIPFFWKRRKLQDFETVTFGIESRGKGKDRTTVHAVRFRGPEYSVVVSDCGGYEEARRTGERAAGFAGLPLRDLVYGGSTRSADELDLTVVEKMKAKGEPRPTPVRPERTWLACHPGPGITEFAVEPPGGMRRALWEAFFWLTIPSILWLEVALTPDANFTLVILVCILSALFLLFGAIRVSYIVSVATFRESLTISRAGLVARRDTRFKNSERHIPANGVEELEICPPKTGSSLFGREAVNILCVRGDKGVVEFGYGLSDEELRWVREEILLGLWGE